ncbi:uncharacterized protein LOC122025309 [Zingiber officinale]|nr:uncharacterized protein LOC122025309 [Zingiber officinale]
MESLNFKLYEKYKNLKKRKISDEEEWTHARDAELRSYQSVVGDLIEQLNKENKGLHQNLYAFQEKYAECKKLLLEEGKRSKELSDEVEKLQNLVLKRNDTSDTLLITSPSTNSRIRSQVITKGPQGQRLPESYQEIVTQNKVGANMQENSGRYFASSGTIDNGSEACSNFVFQTLMRFLVGMDFYVDNQIESLSILVVHKTSGYTFTLTWIQHENDEGEWMYHVTSLGTLESVALDWMKEDIMFSAAMCCDFFERVSLIIGRQCSF